MALSLSSCSTVGHEPEWKPTVYLPGDKVGEFYSRDGLTLDWDEPEMHDMFLAPLSDLEAIKSKLQRCEKWK